jgi:hypothetical protein
MGHRINFCNAVTILTALCSIVAIILYNVIEVAPGIYLTDIQAGKDIQSTTIVTLVFSILLIINDAMMRKYFPGYLVVSSVGICFSIAILISSALGLSRLEEIDNHTVEYNATQVGAMKAMGYLSGAMGIVTSLFCGFHHIHRLAVTLKLVPKK